MRMALIILRAVCVGVLVAMANIHVDERYAQGDISRGAAWGIRFALIVMWLFLCATVGGVESWN